MIHGLENIGKYFQINFFKRQIVYMYKDYLKSLLMSNKIGFVDRRNGLIVYAVRMRNRDYNSRQKRQQQNTKSARETTSFPSNTQFF